MSCTIFDFGGILMAICYDKLWKLLIDKKMNRTELKEASGISFNVLARLGKNEPVSFESIEKICFTLNCKIEDVVEIKKEKSPQIDSDAFTTIELFAGAGGLALGIEKAGFEPLGLIEFDKDAAESLKTNRPNWRVIHDDIANISCLDLEDYFGIKKNFFRSSYPHTSSAISLTNFNLAHCCSSVSLLPIAQEANPHCGLK